MEVSVINTMNAGNSTLHFNELEYCTFTTNDSRGGGGRAIMGAIGLYLRRGCYTGRHGSPFKERGAIEDTVGHSR